MPRLLIPSDTGEFTDGNRVAAKYILAIKKHAAAEQLFVLCRAGGRAALEPGQESALSHVIDRCGIGIGDLCRGADGQFLLFFWNAHCKLGLAVGPVG